jgi:catechol 2,3-dioxygenase-like lactoylglutathione lyase family enzyme
MTETTAQPPGGWPKGIFAITLFVEDLAESKRFYQVAFGLTLEFEDRSSAVYRFGDTMVNLLDVAAAPELIEPARVAPRQAGTRSVFTLQVDDVDALSAQLQARGVTLLNGPLDRPWGPRTASFCDPSGHIWEIAH